VINDTVGNITLLMLFIAEEVRQIYYTEMSQLPLVPCGFCSCSETGATTPCQTDKRICFFSRCCKPTSFLCLKHFIWHGNTETTSEKLPTLLQYLSRQQKNSLLAIMMYECTAKRTKYIFIRLSVMTQLDNRPCTGSPQQSCKTFSLKSTLII
jgi:hypothetical protein